MKSSIQYSWHTFHIDSVFQNRWGGSVHKNQQEPVQTSCTWRSERFGAAELHTRDRILSVLPAAPTPTTLGTTTAICAQRGVTYRFSEQWVKEILTRW